MYAIGSAPFGQFPTKIHQLKIISDRTGGVKKKHAAIKGLQQVFVSILSLPSHFRKSNNGFVMALNLSYRRSS